MNKATVELKFTCGCGFVASDYEAPNQSNSPAVEAAQSHAEEFGHRLHVEGTITPSDKRMETKRIHRAKRAQLAVPELQEKIHERA